MLAALGWLTKVLHANKARQGLEVALLQITAPQCMPAESSYGSRHFSELHWMPGTSGGAKPGIVDDLVMLHTDLGKWKNALWCYRFVTKPPSGFPAWHSHEQLLNFGLAIFAFLGWQTSLTMIFSCNQFVILGASFSNVMLRQSDTFTVLMGVKLLIVCQCLSSMMLCVDTADLCSWCISFLTMTCQFRLSRHAGFPVRSRAAGPGRALTCYNTVALAMLRA